MGCTVALLAGCGDPDAAGDASPTLVPVYVALTGTLPTTSRSVVAHGGAYFAIAENGDGTESELVRSADLRSWQPVDLPGRAARMSLHLGATASGGVLAVSGRVVETETAGGVTMDVPIGAAMLWTSADGTAWEQGPVLDGLGPFATPIVHEAAGVLAAGYAEEDGRFTLLRREGTGEWEAQEVPELSVPSEQLTQLGGRVLHQGDLQHLWTEGDALVGVAWVSSADGSAPDPDHELRSTDRGATWEVRSCAEEWRCGGFGLRTDGLLVRGARSSTDEGASWQDVSIPSGPFFCDPELSSVTRVGAGWVGVGSVHVAGGPSNDGLFHSADGRNWTATRAPACDEAEGESSYTYSAPVEFEGSWWSVYAEHLWLTETTPQPRLLRSDDLGLSWTEVEVSGLNSGVPGDPLVVGDELLIPLAEQNQSSPSTISRLVGLRAER